MSNKTVSHSEDFEDLLPLEEIERMLAGAERRLMLIPDFRLFKRLSAKKLDFTGESKRSSRSKGIELRILVDDDESKERLLKSCAAHFKKTDNKPMSIRELLPIMQAEGFVIQGRNPGTTLGALINRSGLFEMVSKGMWRLRL